jgi:hypothetical protein
MFSVYRTAWGVLHMSGNAVTRYPRPPGASVQDTGPGCSFFTFLLVLVVAVGGGTTYVQLRTVVVCSSDRMHDTNENKIELIPHSFLNMNSAFIIAIFSYASIVASLSPAFAFNYLSNNEHSKSSSRISLSLLGESHEEHVSIFPCRIYLKFM